MKYILRVIIFTIIIDGVFSGLRIVGGGDAKLNELTYVVRMEGRQSKNMSSHIQMNVIPICTCALLTPTWSLTAAHCVGGLKEFMRTKENNTEVKGFIRHGHGFVLENAREILSTVNHPSYQATLIFPYVRNDVALVNAQPIMINQYAKISSIDYFTLIGLEATAVGFGLTNSTKGIIMDTLMLNKSLQVLKIMIIPCSNKNLYNQPAICIARACAQSSSMCPGDSGGPLIHASGVVGVNSMAVKDDCFKSEAERTFEVGYMTPISPFINWISSIISYHT